MVDGGERGSVAQSGRAGEGGAIGGTIGGRGSGRGGGGEELLFFLGISSLWAWDELRVPSRVLFGPRQRIGARRQGRNCPDRRTGGQGARTSVERGTGSEGDKRKDDSGRPLTSCSLTAVPSEVSRQVPGARRTATKATTRRLQECSENGVKIVPVGRRGREIKNRARDERGQGDAQNNHGRGDSGAGGKRERD